MSDDLIRRSDAIKTIWNEWHECLGEYDAQTIIHDTTDAIELIPAASGDDWIECSKELPPEPCGEDYYFIDGDNVYADEYIVMINGATIPTSLYWNGKIWFDPYGCDCGRKYDDVIAWHRMPEPYKPKEPS